MNKKQAIAYLELQKVKINSTHVLINRAWIDAFQDVIFDLFGDNVVYKALSKTGTFRDRNAAHDTYPYLNTVIDEAIEKIKAGAFIEKDKKNFVRKLSDSWLIAIMGLFLTVVLPATFWTGFWFGKHDSPSNQNSKQETTQSANTNQSPIHKKYTGGSEYGYSCYNVKAVTNGVLFALPDDPSGNIRKNGQTRARRTIIMG